MADDTTAGKNTQDTGASRDIHDGRVGDGTQSAGGNDEGEARQTGRRPRRRPTVTASQVKAGSDAVRSRIASVVRTIAIVCAVILGLAAILIALQDNVRSGNPIVQWLTNVSNVLAGPFGDVRDDTFGGGVFNLKSTPREALANWGLAAVVYLVAGRVLDRVIRP